MLATIITASLLFIAFLLLLLVTLSVPIIKTIYLFILSANVSSLLESASGSVKFGVFGYCTTGVNIGGIFSDSVSSAECSKAHLGYTFDSTVASALHLNSNELVNVISKTTTAALVLHPIACALTFMTFLLSLFMLHRGSNGTARLPSLITLGFGILAALFTTIVFLIDVILVAVVRNHVKNDTDNDVTLNWGNAVWMALGATIALWLAMVGACGGVCGCGSRNRRREKY
ncbi:actin cortical patch SUR7/pH-response regulator pali [Rhodocollybia butyracea]|uniref:Actin cortical patch SUR7/pH-response regulator pali n=1 Tax=Rhodocollybia butyracea TaxID=206335 RepID=A0A9P5PTV1_9AGAR|nr:actin cortical patch SUR7/pH-response regulator pali [Rhodocollybia butyracea]